MKIQAGQPSLVSDLIKLIKQSLSVQFAQPIEQNQYTWWILELITKKNRAQLIAQQTLSLSQEETDQLSSIIEAMVLHHKPFAYIAGTLLFCDFELCIEPPILIPRPETEQWVSDLILKLKKFSKDELHILDLGTGSGCIAIAIAKALPQAHVYAFDINQKAVDLAQKNCIKNGISNIVCMKSDLFEKAQDIRFDLIVSNPPYIDEQEHTLLDKSVLKWEDPFALFAEKNGFEIIEKIAQNAAHYLKQNSVLKNHKIPQLLVEIGHQQGPESSHIFKKNGWKQIEIIKDYAQKDRLITAQQ